MGESSAGILSCRVFNLYDKFCSGKEVKTQHVILQQTMESKETF